MIKYQKSVSFCAAALFSVSAYGASPSFESFNTNEFDTSARRVDLKNGWTTNVIIGTMSSGRVTNIVSSGLTINGEFGIALQSSDGDIVIAPTAGSSLFIGSDLSVFTNEVRMLGSLDVTGSAYVDGSVSTPMVLNPSGGLTLSSSGTLLLQSAGDVLIEAAGSDVNIDNADLRVDGNIISGGIFYGDGSGLTNLAGGGGASLTQITNAVLNIMTNGSLTDIVLGGDLIVDHDIIVTNTVYIADFVVTNSVTVYGNWTNHGVIYGDGSGLSNVAGGGGANLVQVTNAVIGTLAGNLVTNFTSPGLTINGEFGITLESSDGDIVISPVYGNSFFVGSDLSVFTNDVRALTNLLVGGNLTVFGRVDASTLQNSSGDMAIIAQGNLDLASSGDVIVDPAGNDVFIENSRLTVSGNITSTDGVFYGDGSGLTNLQGVGGGGFTATQVTNAVRDTLASGLITNITSPGLTINGEFGIVIDSSDGDVYISPSSAQHLFVGTGLSIFTNDVQIGGDLVANTATFNSISTTGSITVADFVVTNTAYIADIEITNSVTVYGNWTNHGIIYGDGSGLTNLQGGGGGASLTQITNAILATMTNGTLTDLLISGSFTASDFIVTNSAYISDIVVSNSMTIYGNWTNHGVIYGDGSGLSNVAGGGGLTATQVTNTILATMTNGTLTDLLLTGKLTVNSEFIVTNTVSISDLVVSNSMTVYGNWTNHGVIYGDGSGLSNVAGGGGLTATQVTNAVVDTLRSSIVTNITSTGLAINGEFGVTIDSTDGDITISPSQAQHLFVGTGLSIFTNDIQVGGFILAENIQNPSGNLEISSVGGDVNINPGSGLAKINNANLFVDSDIIAGLSVKTPSLENTGTVQIVSSSGDIILNAASGSVVIENSPVIVEGNLTANGIIYGNGAGLTNIPGVGVSLSQITNAVHGIMTNGTLTDLILSGNLIVDSNFIVTNTVSISDLVISNSVTVYGNWTNHGIVYGNGAGLTNIPGVGVTLTQVTNAVIGTLAGNRVTNIVSPGLTINGEFGVTIDSSDGNIVISPSQAQHLFVGTGLSIFTNELRALTNLLVGGNLTVSSAINANTLQNSSGDMAIVSQGNLDIASSGDVIIDPSGTDVFVENARLTVSGNITSTDGIFYGNGSGLTNLVVTQLAPLGTGTSNTFYRPKIAGSTVSTQFITVSYQEAGPIKTTYFAPLVDPASTEIFALGGFDRFWAQSYIKVGRFESVITTNLWANRVFATNDVIAGGRFIGNGSGITNLNPSMQYTNILYVDAGRGNDNSAVRGNPDRPWQSIAAAQTNAVLGDSVYVRAGSYSLDRATNTVPGWFLEENAIVKLEQSAAVPYGWQVRGKGVIDLIVTPQNSTNKVECAILEDLSASSGSVITINADELKGSTTNGVYLYADITGATVEINSPIMRIQGMNGYGDEPTPTKWVLNAKEIYMNPSSGGSIMYLGNGSRINADYMYVPQNVSVVSESGYKFYWNVGRTENVSASIGFSPSSSTNYMIRVPQFAKPLSATNAIRGSYSIVE